MPHFAPRISAPRISVPRFAPQIARVPALAAPRTAAQRLARPGHFVSRPLLTGSIAPARALTRTLAGAGRPHITPANVTPANHPNRAFALAGAHGAVHGAVAGHILRNQFFANRPAFARATFQGQFAHFPWRHHRHLRPIVIGWFGPLFWPYGYDDLLGYTFYPYAYDTFWPTAYDDVYDGMLGLSNSGIRAAYAATGRPPPATSGGRAVGSGICSGQTAGVTDWQINEIAQAVEPDEAQRATLDELKAATAQALDILKAACPAELPSTPTGRIDAMQCAARRDARGRTHGTRAACQILLVAQ